MAGIGVKLNKIYRKKTLLAHLAGFAYSTIITIAPMIIIMITIVIMEKLLGYEQVSYARRSLFSCTVLYIFIFALLAASPFNAVLSRFMSDVIYQERYGDIMPCFYTGLWINIVFGAIFGIPFVIHEFLTKQVDPMFIFVSYCGYFALILVFYTMLYLSICKDYTKITWFYFVGMLVSVGSSLLLVKLCHMEIVFGMLLSLVIGFLVVAILEIAQVKNYFHENTRAYLKVLPYFKDFWPLIVSNFLYVCGLYVHNFVFWTSDLRMEVVDTFVCAEPYDMATFLALVTNFTSTVIFISNVEIHFHQRYKAYSESVIGGRLSDIENAKSRMFGQLSTELSDLTRIQFIISVVIFLIFIVCLPMIGIAGLPLQIYPCLAAGYFVLFIMYGELIFLYYFNDLSGAVITAGGFFITTIIGALISMHFSTIWYGMGLFVGAFVGWMIGYFRLRWVERHMDIHIFCRGNLMKKGRGNRPSDRVYTKEGLS